MPSHSAAERQALADALTEAGPDAPTLCSGWTTTDLAVHLVLRESRPHVLLSETVGVLRPWAERTTRACTARPYPDLVDRVRNGPPRTSVMALPGVDARANLLEHLVHCEDVRRAVPDWQPRDLPADRQDAVWAVVTGMFGKALLRRAKVPARLQAPGRASVTMVDGPGEPVVISGEPAEIALYLFGRKEQARIELLGPQDRVAQIREARLRV